MNYIQSSGACCNPCTSPVVTTVPGQAGEDGLPGDNGLNGTNAFTVVGPDGFTMPDVGLTVTFVVGSTLWMVPGQAVYVQGGGTMHVASIPDASTVELENPGDNGNAAPGTPIAPAAKIGPGGFQGASGTSSAKSGTVAIPNGVDSYTLPNQNFGFVPTTIIISISMPTGGDVIVGSVETATITGQTFKTWFSEATPSAGYALHYLAIP